MAFDKEDMMLGIGVGVAVAFLIAARIYATSKRAENTKDTEDEGSDNGGWPYVETEPTETDMLMQSLLMRPAVNAELNYLYGSAPAVSLGRMTDMIVGTPLPYGM
jgi:hypothetical protein